MERSEAKEGVRVRYMGDHDPSYPNRIGDLGVIIRPEGTIADVRFDCGDSLPCAYENLEVVLEPWLQVDYVTPPALSPIAVETRRYVKAGQYGNLTVYEGPAKDIRIEFTTCSHTPAQMRAAAKVLNQIAEVLEENAS